MSDQKNTNAGSEDDGFIYVSTENWLMLLEVQRKHGKLPPHLEAEYWNYKLGFKKL